MKNLGNMLKQAQQMQTRMQEMQAKLEATEVEGQAGAGMVKVRLTGKGDLRRVSIDPSLMAADEREVTRLLVFRVMAAASECRCRARPRCRAAGPQKSTSGFPARW